jgi:hypothetical protein
MGKEVGGGMAPRDTESMPLEERDRVELQLLNLAREWGNVAKACRHLGVDRSVYYRARKRQRDDNGARARSLLAKPLKTENRLIALCLEFPDWGCDRLAYYLTLTGDPVSSPTVQKILIRHGLGQRRQRGAAHSLMGKSAGDFS